MMIPQNLYEEILKVLPIPAVDLIVENEQGKLLLVRRANEPAKGQWWFPGGRVHFMETRLQAVNRKLQEECGLKAEKVTEVDTFDVIVERSDAASVKLHGITTLFHVQVGSQVDFVLDEQNSEADWRLPKEWLQLDLHPFVHKSLLIFKD